MEYSTINHMSTLGNNISLLTTYKKEVLQEWKSILKYWMDFTIDKDNGGFFGSVNNDNIPNNSAARGLVMYSRILWSFSAAYHYFNDDAYLQTANKAYSFIQSNFADNINGGMYWSVDENGKVLDGKKQIYALAFCIYGMAEYYKCTKDVNALNTAIDLFNIIEKYSYDILNHGYFEAFAFFAEQIGRRNSDVLKNDIRGIGGPDP